MSSAWLPGLACDRWPTVPMQTIFKNIEKINKQVNFNKAMSVASVLQST